VEDERMEKQLDDIYKEIQDSLAEKAEVGNDNNDNDKKHEERNTIKYMFLNPIKETARNSIVDTARVDE
jgi:hypothetical protein